MQKDQPERIPNMFEKQEAKRQESELKVSLVENGFILKTKSGWWIYATEKELFVAISDYLRVCKKEKEGESK